MNLQKETESPYSPEIEAKVNQLTEEYNKKFRDLIVQSRLGKSPKKVAVQPPSKQPVPIKATPVVATKLNPEEEAKERFKYGIG